KRWKWSQAAPAAIMTWPLSSHADQSLFVLPPSTWCAEVAAPHRKLSGKRKRTASGRRIGTAGARATVLDFQKLIGGRVRSTVRRAGKLESRLGEEALDLAAMTEDVNDRVLEHLLEIVGHVPGRLDSHRADLRVFHFPMRLERRHREGQHVAEPIETLGTR